MLILGIMAIDQAETIGATMLEQMLIVGLNKTSLSDGIGDTLYTIDSYNIDGYPLMIL